MSEAANLFSLAALGQSDPIKDNVELSASEAPSALVGEQWLVAHRELRSNRRIRAVYDFLAHKLAR